MLVRGHCALVLPSGLAHWRSASLISTVLHLEMNIDKITLSVRFTWPLSAFIITSRRQVASVSFAPATNTQKYSETRCSIKLAKSTYSCNLFLTVAFLNQRIRCRIYVRIKLVVTFNQIELRFVAFNLCVEKMSSFMYN